jgi:molecular chaperone DnaK
VLLVGGTTRIPCVRRFVAECLGAAPQSLVDPDLTVARGAAIQAGILEGVIAGEREIILTDVSPYTLGVAVMNEGALEDRLRFDPLIPRNTTIPAEKAKIYSTYVDYQTAANIKVYQGEALDPDHNEFLGEVMLTGIPAAKKGKEPLEVTFAYDMNGILQVKGSVVSTRKAVSAEINIAGMAPKPVLDLSKWESAPGAKRQRPMIRRAEKRIADGNDESGEMELLVRQIKEALLLEDSEEDIERLRDGLRELLEDLR